MLENGLGEILSKEADSSERIVDLFCGAGSVSWFSATKLGKPVLACDLQHYATVLAGAVVQRTRAIPYEKANELWLLRAYKTRSRLKGWEESEQLDAAKYNIGRWRKCAQELCSSDAAAHSSIIWRCYGGHYFSPMQALSFDAMLKALPKNKQLRQVCLAAIIKAASHCVASPGHTAQPFKASRTAGPYLREAWIRDPFDYARKALEEICPMHADKLGRAVVADANQKAKYLKSSDLVFIDPPYSSVQYSRFYHVLEAIAKNSCGETVGVGRYPPIQERPNSRYSRQGASEEAMRDLLKALAEKKCNVILTFPQSECSNGLSGYDLEALARKSFRVRRKVIKSRFSTLGGNSRNRKARETSDELILILKNR